MDAFKGKPQLLAVEELYSQLKNEGVEFPPIDLDTMAPIETPNRVSGGGGGGGDPVISEGVLIVSNVPRVCRNKRSSTVQLEDRCAADLTD